MTEPVELHVERFATAPAFLEAAGDYLGEREAEHDLLDMLRARVLADYPARPRLTPPRVCRRLSRASGLMDRAQHPWSGGAMRHEATIQVGVAGRRAG